MKLNPEELVVTSFDTSAEPSLAAGAVAPLRPITGTTDPTAATWCYICPAETENCW